MGESKESVVWVYQIPFSWYKLRWCERLSYQKLTDQQTCKKREIRIIWTWILIFWSKILFFFFLETWVFLQLCFLFDASFFFSFFRKRVYRADERKCESFAFLSGEGLQDEISSLNREIILNCNDIWWRFFFFILYSLRYYLTIE